MCRGCGQRCRGDVLKSQPTFAEGRRRKAPDTQGWATEAGFHVKVSEIDTQRQSPNVGRADLGDLLSTRPARQPPGNHSGGIHEHDQRKECKAPQIVPTPETSLAVLPIGVWKGLSH